jgi:cephalosporin-C deacetylase-like acetyl esterase
MKNRWGKFSVLIILFNLLFLLEPLYAQLQSPNKSTDLLLKKDEENLDVFQQWIRWNNPGSLLINHLIKQAFDFYDIRDKEIAKLKSESDWRNRQETVRQKLMEFIGPFPPKGPLNPKIIGVIKKKGYHIEKIIYESLPGFYVTGCLYVPEKIKGKVPAVLNVIGHNQESFRNPLYQVINYNLVMKGIMVFAIDPPGQGEHVQYYDPKIKLSSVGYSVIEHCFFGNQCFLSGSSCAKYFIWDGMRAIDYLLTRKDVDPDRIGVTGFSGGGTVTSYIGAFDERVKVSIPCSWATVSRRQLETKGGQDSETGFYKQVAKGITLEDLLEVRAPKPTLLTFVSRDEYLCLQGAREVYNESKKAFELLGHGDNLAMVEDDSKHWMTPKIRLTMYSFFMKHFNVSGDPSETEADILTPEELTVTPTGQVSTYLGGDMIFDVNKRETEKLLKNLEVARKDIEKHLATVKVKAKEISGYVDPVKGSEFPFINGRYHRDGYTVGKYAIRGEGDYAIPILLFVPDDNSIKHPAIVYVNSKGKAADAKPGGEIEKLVMKGYVVAATDPLGVGETTNTAARGITDGYTAIIIGRSVVGIQAGDIVRTVNYLKDLNEVDSSRVGAIGLNEMCLPLLHAAAFDHSIKNITLIGSLISFRSVVMNRFYKIGLTAREGGGLWHPNEVDFSWGVAGVLTAYDLPDLIGCIAPRKVQLAGTKDQMLEPASDDLVNQDAAFPISVYAFKNASGNFRIVKSDTSPVSLVEWSFK